MDNPGNTIKRTPGTGSGNSKARMARHRNIAAAIREIADPTEIATFYLAILEGHDPRLEPYTDEDGETRRRVVWDERGGLHPSLEQKMAAAKELYDRGWGRAVETVRLEADLRQSISLTSSGVTAGALPPSAFASIRDALAQRRAAALPPPASVEDAEVIDAEFTELAEAPPPASADHDDADGEE